MAVLTEKFSEFLSGGDLTNGSTTVGLFTGTNAKFNNPWTFLPSGTTADRPTIASTMYYRQRLNTDIQAYEYYDPISLSWIQLATDNAFDWNVVTTNQVMFANNGYITNSGSLVILGLPALSDVGAELSIVGLGAGGWEIIQNTGQSIIMSPSITTVGGSGAMLSTNRYDTVNLVCIVANLTWSVIGGPQSAGLTIV